jgi:hypothetical protein
VTLAKAIAPHTDLKATTHRFRSTFLGDAIDGRDVVDLVDVHGSSRLSGDR